MRVRVRCQESSGAHNFASERNKLPVSKRSLFSCRQARNLPTVEGILSLASKIFVCRCLKSLGTLRMMYGYHCYLLDSSNLSSLTKAPSIWVKTFFFLIDRMRKWRPKKYSFVYVLIRLTSLALKQHFFCILYMQTRLVSLVSS